MPLIETYLQDHHAGSAAGVDAFQRIAKGHSDPAVREAVTRIAVEVEADQAALESIMAAFRVKPSLLKDVPARVAEKVGRLKPNQRIVRRSPLSDVVELEGLVMAVHGKSLGWRILRELADPRLDKTQLADLHARALAQLEELEALRLGQSAKLLSE